MSAHINVRCGVMDKGDADDTPDEGSIVHKHQGGLSGAKHSDRGDSNRRDTGSPYPSEWAGGVPRDHFTVGAEGARW